MRAIKKQKYLHITPPFSKWPWALLVRAVPTKDNDKSESIKQHYCSRKQPTCNPTTFYYSLIELHNLLSFTQGLCVGRKKPEGASSSTCCREFSVLQHFCSCAEVLKPTVLTVLGLAQVQQVAATVIHGETHVHPTAPAHALAPLHALPLEQERRMADPAPVKHSDAVSEAQVGMLSASELATCPSPEAVRGSWGLGRDASNIRLSPSPSRKWTLLSGKYLRKEIN